MPLFSRSSNGNLSRVMFATVVARARSARLGLVRSVRRKDADLESGVNTNRTLEYILKEKSESLSISVAGTEFLSPRSPRLST